MLVQIYLSFGTLEKVVCLAKKVSKDTFSSIITPVLDLDSVLSLMSDIKVVLPDISQRYMPWVSRIPLHQGLKWELRDSFLQPITADSQAAYSCQDIPTTPPPLKGWKKKISSLSKRGRHLANSSLLWRGYLNYFLSLLPMWNQAIAKSLRKKKYRYAEKRMLVQSVQA